MGTEEGQDVNETSREEEDVTVMGDRKEREGAREGEEKERWWEQHQGLSHIRGHLRVKLLASRSKITRAAISYFSFTFGGI